MFRAYELRMEFNSARNDSFNLQYLNIERNKKFAFKTKYGN